MITISSSVVGQWNEKLWNCYLIENQLAENKVKLIIIEGSDIINHYIRPDGKIRQTIIANSNKVVLGYDKYIYYGDTLINFSGYRNHNIYIRKDFTYENGFLVNEYQFQNDRRSTRYMYSPYPNGWFGFVAKYRIDGIYEHEVWTKKINYYVNGFIKDMNTKIGFSNHTSYYLYNPENNFIEKEIIGSTIDNVIQEKNKEIEISTYDNGLTKSIINNGYTQNLSYQYYSKEEFEAVSDTLELIKTKIETLEKTTKELSTRLKPNYQYMPNEIYSIYLDYKRKTNSTFEYQKKLLILSEGISKITQFNNMQEKELRKMNRKLKAKYGL